MTPYPYMISIQWGKGHHYFRGGSFNMEGALALAKTYHDQAMKTKKRSKMKLQPRVMIWELRASEQDESVGPIDWNSKP